MSIRAVRMNKLSDLNRECCPDRESVLSVMEGGCIPSWCAGAILNHIANCDECRRAVAFVCAALVFEKSQRSTRTEHCWRRVFSAIDVWRNRTDEEAPDALAAAAPKRVLAFVSRPQASNYSGWRAEVHLPAPDDLKGELKIVVWDEKGNPLAGKFCFCGIECMVEVGKTATIPVVEFRKKHSSGGVAFAESGKPFTDGIPIIGSIL